MTLRAVIYARHSSENQRDASIEDQVRVCRACADSEGWLVHDIYSDRAASGATTLRSGYQALMAKLRGGGIDVVLAESLDRFSRDLEHIAGFYKQCMFHQVRIHTVAEGDITELHVGLKGTIGALYLKRRGLEGRIHAGRCTGAPAYGYTVVRNLKEDGELDRGLRAIDPDKAAIVRRVFEAYPGGASPRRIAQTLNAEAIAGPRSGVWFTSTIRGRAKRGDGLLRNELYIGRIVWHRRVNAKDPVSCAIIGDELWRRVQDRLGREAAPDQADPNGVRSAFWDRRRPRHLLSGKVFCGACGRPLSLFGRDYVGCKAAAHGTCQNRRTIRREVPQVRVMDALRRQLRQPKLVLEFIAEFNHEWQRLMVETKPEAATQQRARAALDRRVANLIEAIADGRSSPAIMAKLAELEVQKARLLDLPPPVAAAPLNLHPNIAQVYAAKIRDLDAALADQDRPEALEAARSLVEKVIVHSPAIDDDSPRVELMALLRAGGVGDPQAGAQSAGPDAVISLFVSSVKAAPRAEP